MFWDPDISLSGIATLVGLIGAGTYLLSYALLQLGLVRGQGLAYASMVIFSASCVAFSTIEAPNASVLLIQVSYIVISLFGIGRRFVTTRMLRQTPEERAFITKHLPDLRREHVRALLQRGGWQDLPPGMTLCREGAALDRLYFLSEGEAIVKIEGGIVGRCHDCFIGELSFLTGDRATATVETAGPCRVLVFRKDLLAPLLKRQPDIRLALIAGFSSATKRTLVRRNREALEGAATSV